MEKAEACDERSEDRMRRCDLGWRRTRERTLLRSRRRKGPRPRGIREARARTTTSSRSASGLDGSFKAGPTTLPPRGRAGSCASFAGGCNASGRESRAGGPGVTASTGSDWSAWPNFHGHAPPSATPGRTSGSPPSARGRSRMDCRPCPDLCGGCAAMRIPAATGGRGSTTTRLRRPAWRREFDSRNRRDSNGVRFDQRQRCDAGVAELVDAPDLGSGAQKAWGFKSLHPHQKNGISGLRLDGHPAPYASVGHIRRTLHSVRLRARAMPVAFALRTNSCFHRRSADFSGPCGTWSARE